MAKAFELLVFDWDGTLMDSEAHIVACMQRAARDLGLEELAREAVRDIIGLGLREALMALLPGRDEATYRALTERYRVHFFTDDACQPFAGAETVLQELQDQGYLLAIATGKGRHGLDRVLHSTGFQRFFTATRCADEARSKPDPQMLHDILELLAVDPHRALMIGDTEYDLRMARAAGTHLLGVDYGVHDRQRLLQCEPLGCLGSIAELPGWLREYNRQSGAA
jgi:phosphoglycolate phosphatase